MGTEKWVQAYHHSFQLPAPPAGAGNSHSANMVAGRQGYMENKGTNFDNRTPPLEGKAVLSGKGKAGEVKREREPGLMG